MKIGIDIRCLMEPRYTGVGEYTLNLLKNLFELDRQNEYLLFYNAHGNCENNLPVFNYPNVRYKGFKYPNKFLNLSLSTFHRPCLDQMLGGVQVFFAPHISFLALSKKCKKILTVHDLSFKKLPEFFPAKRRFWFHLYGAECDPRDFDLIIADSENTKRDLIKEYGIAESRIKVIYLGVESRYKPVELNAKMEEIRHKYNLPNKFILYLGTLEPRKNLVSLIKAYEQLGDSEHELVIAGNPGWMYQDIYKIAKKSQMAGKIKFIGYVEPLDKVYLYNLAGLFVYISFYEGFGFPPLEAMACGTSVIASFTSSLGEVIEDAGILVNPYNVAEISSAIWSVLHTTGLQNDLKQKGIEQVRKFTWQKTANDMLKIFNSIEDIKK